MVTLFTRAVPGTPASLSINAEKITPEFLRVIPNTICQDFQYYSLSALAARIYKFYAVCSVKTILVSLS